jgi:predicted outer membrane lipoprotein
MTGILTGGLLLLFARFPWLGGVFGLLLAAAFGFLGVSSWHDLQTMPERPEVLTLADAALRVNAGEFLWVELEDIEWDCSNIVQSGGGSEARTEVVFTDESHNVLGVATFSDRLACEDIVAGTAAGILRRMSDGVYERLSPRGFDLAGYADVEARVSLCAFCGRRNSLLGVILAAIFVPIGLLMYPLCLYMRKDARKKDRL